MKVYEVICADGMCVNPKEETIYKNKLVFDDCFSIFDVHDMLRTYFIKKGLLADFQICLCDESLYKEAK